VLLCLAATVWFEGPPSLLSELGMLVWVGQQLEAWYQSGKEMFP
jgi:hypothetical protein